MKATAIKTPLKSSDNDNIKKNNFQKQYRYWRFRIMYSIMIGYAAFYMIRYNFNMIMPLMQSEFGYSKTQIGTILTISALFYGCGKTINGIFSDYSNPRYFMSIGLLGSAIMNVCMGFCDGFYGFLFFWTLNSCFQSMGWAPCARLLTHWFSARELATKWAFWNSSQQVGNAAIAILAPNLAYYFHWRWAFIVPALLCVGFAAFLLNRLRDTPSSLGLPTIEEHHGLDNAENEKEDHRPLRQVFWHSVIKNKLVWYVCFANFFTYVVRSAILSWGPMFLCEFKGNTMAMAGYKTALFDGAAIIGGILAGYLSDGRFGGRRGPVSTIFMFVLAIFVVFFWQLPPGYYWLNTLGWIMIGFCISGPQILAGVAATDFSSKRVAGVASGLTGTFGYFATALTGVGMGAAIDYYGWDYAFFIVSLSAVMAALFFALTWQYRAEQK